MGTLIPIIFFSLYSQASIWTELSLGKTYRLTQDLQLSQNERSRSKLDLVKGSRAELISKSDEKYIFNYQNCPGSEMTTELENIPVQETTPVVEIGAELKENCKLHIYIEKNVLMSKSIFE